MQVNDMHFSTGMHAIAGDCEIASQCELRGIYLEELAILSCRVAKRQIVPNGVTACVGARASCA